MIFRNRFYFLIFTITVVLSSVSYARADMVDQPEIKIQALNKSTARTETFTAKVGSTLEYGSLFIKTKACRKSEPLDKPENAAFLQIWEVPIGREKSEWAFSGWMFSSSPGVSAMDHPVYDVWVLDCFDSKAKVEKPVNKVIVDDVEVVEQDEDGEGGEGEEETAVDVEEIVEEAVIEEEVSETSEEAEPFDSMIETLSDE